MNNPKLKLTKFSVNPGVLICNTQHCDRYHQGNLPFRTDHLTRRLETPLSDQFNV